jgi:cyclin-dependent kinase 5 activator 1
MGTVLSFSPRENHHPIYSTQHHRGSGTMSTSSSADFSLNNAYEQMNNVKNSTKTNIISNNNGSSLVLFGSTNSNIMNNNLTSNVVEQSDSARILSEKNAIEKNLKKHSLFINALSWKRLSSSHGKKKLESYNTKNKAGNLTASSFRPPALTDTVHPMVEKNKNYQQQQIQFASNNNHNNNLNIHHVKDNLHAQSNIYFSPGPKSLLALDLQNSNNLQHHQHVEKLGPKIPLQLPLAMHHHQQPPPQHFRPGPRKTIIQVSYGVIVSGRKALGKRR